VSDIVKLTPKPRASPDSDLTKKTTGESALVSPKRTHWHYL